MAISQLRLAVFTSQVPWGKSESFVLTEIAELRSRVEAILVIPVRPDSALFHGELARRVGQYAIRLPVVSPMILICAVAAFVRSPGRVARALVEVIKGSSRLSVLMKNLVVFPKAVYVARLVRRFGAHHIHAHWASVPATMALVVSRLTGVPWSFTAHRWDIAENNLLGTKIRAAVFARVISLHGRDEILKILRESTCSRLLVIHMGTTLPNQDDVPFVKNKREFHIACIGNLLEVKGHRYLIEACGLLRKRGCRFVCHIIGGGPLRSNLEALVHDYGLQECVQLRGCLPHDEVIRMLQRREIDVVVHPSIETSSGEHEGIPVALMEAMAHRVLAISTESGGIPELLGGGAGVLVKPADAKALADAIQRVIEDSDYRATLIEAGLAKVSADFNLRTVAEQLIALMEAPGRDRVDGSSNVHQ
jgi:glycosyltransferase involved in cell wall biosynthesis